MCVGPIERPLGNTKDNVSTHSCVGNGTPERNLASDSRANSRSPAQRNVVNGQFSEFAGWSHRSHGQLVQKRVFVSVACVPVMASIRAA